MAEPLTITDDGFIAVEINGAKNRLDLYDVHNYLLELDADIRNKNPDAPDVTVVRQFNAKVKDYLETLGFGTISTRAADEFASGIFEAVKALGKASADAPTPA